MKKLIPLGTILTALVSGAALAQESPQAKKPSKKTTKDVTSEQRKNMAAMHEKMAACLRSDTPMRECRDEMHQQCMDMMGKDGCPMMGQRMNGGRMHHEGMMGGQADSE